MSTVIKVENLSKQYRLGEIGTGTLSHDINRWWHKVRGKEDPYLKIGEANDRTAKGTSDYVWALQDINFEVKAGEVLGIIGRNGAGKSTLLKILSKTTTPTTGSIKVKGRIASLLEVGTGFHPELSGRDNIFLNGAILGMKKKEIASKFDEIVDFAGVERYIDTPVKRYSSGMYVRLAFAVAAHLEPEILIVDEVLAVGDAEFQKKCLGKMKDVSVNDGRTVLFVSHNIGAIQHLCTSGLYMYIGTIRHFGDINSAVDAYMTSNSEASPQKKKLANELTQWHKNTLNRTVDFVSIELLSGDGLLHAEQDDIVLELVFSRLIIIPNSRIGFGIQSTTGDYVGVGFASGVLQNAACGQEKYKLTIKNPGLAKGIYTIDVSIGTGEAHENNIIDQVIIQKCVTFEIAFKNNERNLIPYWNTIWGKLHFQATSELLSR